jgi:hypothetical protein
MHKAWRIHQHRYWNQRAGEADAQSYSLMLLSAYLRVYLFSSFLILTGQPNATMLVCVVRTIKLGLVDPVPFHGPEVDRCRARHAAP